MRIILRGMILLVLVSTLGGCASVGIRDEDFSGARQPVSPPERVYVMDFAFRVRQFIPRENAGETRQLLSEVRDTLTLRTTRAMQRDGFDAIAVRRGTDLPDTGWLVTGYFTQLYEGDRLMRAALGFGAGKTETRTRVYFYDLSQESGGRLRPFYRFRTVGGSGAMPGAVPSLGFGALGPGAGAGGLLEIPETVNYASQGLKLLPGLQGDVKRTARMINGAYQDYLARRGWIDPDHQLTHPKRVGQPAGGILVR